jgi:hypothetical protein
VIVIIFALAALLGAMLLSAALVAWLNNMGLAMHSALLVTGLFYVAIALVVYYTSLRASVLRWRQRLDVVYHVSASFDSLWQQGAALLKKIVGDI